MTLTAPTTAYRPVAPAAYALQTYLPYLINKLVRLGRDNGYAQIVDDGIEILLSDFNVRRPAGGFVDSDGRNAQGVIAEVFGPDGYSADGYDRNGYDRDGYNADGFNADGNSQDDDVANMVDGWTAAYAALVMTALADRIA